AASGLGSSGHFDLAALRVSGSIKTGTAFGATREAVRTPAVVVKGAADHLEVIAPALIELQLRFIRLTLPRRNVLLKFLYIAANQLFLFADGSFGNRTLRFEELQPLACFTHVALSELGRNRDRTSLGKYACFRRTLRRKISYFRCQRSQSSFSFDRRRAIAFEFAFASIKLGALFC